MIFPPELVAVTVLFRGAAVQSYNHAYLRCGRVIAPLVPFVSRMADRIGYEGRTMLIERSGHAVRIRIEPRDPRALASTYVEIAPVLRALGLTVEYVARSRELEVRANGMPAVATFGSQRSQAAPLPTIVFTPEPVITPRPLYTGSPHPRRTPIVITTSGP